MAKMENPLMPTSMSVGHLKLPNEILENIFAQLPLTDLLTTHVCVCKTWSEIIRNPVFLPWKKLYLSIKLERSSSLSAVLLGPSRKEQFLPAQNIMQDIFKTYSLNNLRTFLINCVCLMGKLHKLPNATLNAINLLKHHRLFRNAQDFLKWIPDVLISQPDNLWHLVTTIIILADDVWDIHSVLLTLVLSQSNFATIDVMEAFYCLATTFLYATMTINLPLRYHYMLHYAIYMYENAREAPVEKVSPKKHYGQQDITSKQKILTHEQAKIVRYDIKKSDIVKIVAFAGTGKTTTLLRFCKERPHMKFLLIVYNKSVQDFCKNAFPNNTTVRTAHAMAYAYIGRKYGAIRKFEANLKPMKIVDVLESKIEVGNRYRRAGLAIATIEKFVNSADPWLTLSHVPNEDKHGKSLSDDFRLEVVLDDAVTVWKEITKCSPSQRISMFQDGQLKEWQLKKPKILGYDVIMIDEGQDMNPTMFDIFLNQDSAKIIVGDPYQQIYAFRGAVNALQSINATRTFYLTQSFRFGPEIGFISHCILEKLLNVRKQTLVGGAIHDTILEPPDALIHSMQKAYLCRTNFYLYKLALKFCQSEESINKKIAYAGGIEKYGFEDVIDIFKLSQVEQGFGTAETLGITNKLIAKFSNVGALKYFAVNVDDKELQNKIKMFNLSNHRTLDHINLLRQRCCRDTKMADIVLSTIHKAKGLEWDWVILADDSLTEGVTYYKSANKDDGGEFNLLYVAVTRAKKRLTINSATLHALNLSQEKLERIAHASEITDNATLCLQCGFLCLDTDREKSSAPLITKILSLPFSSNSLMCNGGFICDKCAALEVFEPLMACRNQMEMMPRVRLTDYARIARYCILTGCLQSNLPGDHLLRPIRWDQYRQTPISEYKRQRVNQNIENQNIEVIVLD